MPTKGDVFWVDFPAGIGSEQGGRRPSVIIQNDRGNASSPTTVVAIISAAPLPRVYPFTVRLAGGEANLSRSCYINCSQIFTVDRVRLEDYVGTVSEDRMQQVEAALRYEFDL